MEPSAYGWVEGESFCITVVTGLGVDAVRIALGGVAQPGMVTGLDYLDQCFSRPLGARSLIGLLPITGEPTTTVMFEYSGIRGVDDDVIAKLAAGGYALSAFQNVNLLIFLYGAARDGSAVTQTLSDDWALLRQLRVDEPMPRMPAGSALAAMRDLGFMTQERAEAVDMDTYLREIADFWPKMFAFIERATGVDLTSELVLGPGYTVIEVA